MSILEQVKKNLLYYCLWTEISELHLPDVTLLRGKPPGILNNDEIGSGTDSGDKALEIIMPIRLQDNLSMSMLEAVFKGLENTIKTRPKRIILGIINDDSTVVYYFVYDGVYKPRKN